MKLLLMLLSGGICTAAGAQGAEEVVALLKAKINKVNDYRAAGKLKTNVAFIKAPVADVTVYFKKPGKLRVKNDKGISFIPKGTMNISMAGIFNSTGKYQVLDAGHEPGTGYRIIKMLPEDENSDVVLSTLYVDEKQMLVRKARTTTRESGTYELEMTYGKYAEYGLADNIVFIFNVSDYKLPKGVTFDYDDGSEKKERNINQLKDKKGRIEISYSSYIINKGLKDEVFE